MALKADWAVAIVKRRWRRLQRSVHIENLKTDASMPLQSDIGMGTIAATL